MDAPPGIHGGVREVLAARQQQRAGRAWDVVKSHKKVIHRPILDPNRAEILRQFFDGFSRLPYEERVRLRNRWAAFGRELCILIELYLVAEASISGRRPPAFAPLPPPSQALTERDVAYAHRPLLLLGSMLDLPPLSVSLKDVTAYTNGPRHDTRPKTLLSGFYRLPCFRRWSRDTILEDTTVHFAPSCMHLIMGPPLSGKSAMLHALAGRLNAPGKVASFIKLLLGKRRLVVKGEALENGIAIPAKKRNMLLYAEGAQYEVHMPALTVFETIDFANHLRSADEKRVKGASDALRLLLPIVSRMRTRTLIDMFGLQSSADTLIGNGVTIRGVSGGQRRRVTAAEPVATMMRVGLLDVPTNGLDTATAADIIRDLKILAFAMRMTMIVALMQPPPEVFSLFTSVTLLDAGAVIYHGPIQAAEEYFRALGFRRPKGCDVADYLLDLCTPRRVRHYVGGGRGLKDFRAARSLSDRLWSQGPPPDATSLDFGVVLARAAGRCAGFQYSNWTNPTDKDLVAATEEKDVAAADAAKWAPDVMETILGAAGHGPRAGPVLGAVPTIGGFCGATGSFLPPPPPPPPPGQLFMPQLIADAYASGLPGVGAGGAGVATWNPQGTVGPHSSANPYLASPDAASTVAIGGAGPVAAGPTTTRGGVFSRVWSRVTGRGSDDVSYANYAPSVITVSAGFTGAGMGPGEVVIPMVGGLGASGRRETLTREAMVDGNNVLSRDGLKAAWLGSSLYEDTVKAIELEAPVTAIAQAHPLYKTRYAKDGFTQFKALVKRQWLIYLRTPAFLKARVIAATIVGIILGTLFFRMPATYSWIQTRVGLLFFIVIFIAFGALNNVEPWITERRVFSKQYSLQFYRVIPYIAATTVVTLPTSLLEGFFMGTLVWWMALPNPWFYRYIYFIIVLVLVSFVMASCFRMVSAFSKNDTIGHAIAVVIIVSFVVFCGFVLPKECMGGWVVWIYWASPLKWALEAIAIIVLNRQTFTCTQSELWRADLIPKYVPDFTYVNVNGTSITASPTATTSYYFCPVTTGSEALANSHFHRYEYWIFINMAILLGYAFLFILIAGLATAWIHFEPEHGIRMPQQEEQDVEPELPDCPPTPLVWRGIDYSIHAGGGWKALLNNVNGYALPGTMTALMGESGAGKTTLMDVVAHRKAVGKAEGVIMLGEKDVSGGIGDPDAVSGKGFAAPETPGFLGLLKRAVGGDRRARMLLKSRKEARKTLLLFKASTGYVLQFDTLCPYETVRESVEFSARLRLPGVPAEERAARVEACLALLELLPVADIQIGGIEEVGGVSDSQRKLASIAVELVANPPVIFLDEPTTGLDPQGAITVVQALRRIADCGRAVLATIHQPSTRLFGSFDRLLLLRRGGRTAYFGAIHSSGPGVEIPKFYVTASHDAHMTQEDRRRMRADRREDFASLTGYFGGLPGVRKCGPEQNPASWMLDVIGAGAGAGGGADYAEIWSHSPQGHAAKTEVETLVTAQNPKLPPAEVSARRDLFCVMPARPHNLDHHTTHHRRHHAKGSMEHHHEHADRPEEEERADAVASAPWATAAVGLLRGDVHAADVSSGPNAADSEPQEFIDARAKADEFAVSNFAYPKRCSFFEQLIACTRRLWRLYWRCPSYLVVRVGLMIFLGLFFGFSYWRVHITETGGVLAIAGFLYLSTVFLVSANGNLGLPFWYGHRPCFYREALGTEMYHPVVYGLAVSIVELPYAILCTSVFVFPAYYLIDMGFHGGDQRTFWTYWFCIFSGIMFAVTLGQLVIFATPSMAQGQMCFSLIMPLLTLFNGFLIHRNQIPRIWIWLYFANPFRWLLEAVFVNHFKPRGYLNCPGTDLDSDPMVVITCPYDSGVHIIGSFDMWKHMLWPDLAIFWGFIILLRVIGLLVIWKRKPPAS